MRFLPGSCLVLCLLVGQAHAAITHDPSLQWYSIESPHFIVHYHDGETMLAPRVAAIAERVQQRLSQSLQWTPRAKTDLILSDETDFANGYASVFPSARLTIYVSAPDDINSLEDHDDWLEYLITHEYTHILHLDKVQGTPAGLQNIFGRHFLLFPNQFQPRWLIEGIATYEETDTTRGIGRGQSSYFDMQMRIEVAAGLKPVEQVNQPISSWPSGNTPYLYGVYYYEFLRDKYGSAGIQRLVENYSRNIIPFQINSTSMQTFGKDIAPLWDEYEAYLHAKFQTQLTAIQQQGEQAGKPLTNAGYYAGPLRALPDGRLFFIAYRGDTHPALYTKAPGGAVQKLREVNPGSRLELHAQQGILLLQPERCHGAAVYYDLYRVDFNGEHLQRLTQCGRYHHAVWSADGTQIIAAQQILGVASLQLLHADGSVIRELWRAGDTTELSAMTIHPDGQQLVATLWRPDAGWNLEQFDIAAQQWHKLTDDTAIENQPQFSADGKSLLYSADYDGVYNIYRLTLANGQRERLTNVSGGAFSPVLNGERLYYIGYGAQGFDVFALDQPKSMAMPTTSSKYVAAVVPSTPPPVPPLSAPRDYSPWSGLQPQWWFPHLLLTKQRTEAGAVTSATDALRRHTYSIDAAYDSKNSWWLGSASYVYDRYWPIMQLAVQRDATFYLGGDNSLQHARLEDVALAQVILPFTTLRDSWTIHAAALHDQERDRWVAPGVTPYRELNDDLLGVGITYRSAARFPKSISRSEGRDVRLVAEDSDRIGKSDYSGRIFSLDWREFFALGNQHVLALRYVAGYGTEQPRPFRLGGIQGNNNALMYLFGGVGEPLFNVRKYTLRGYDEGYAALSGRRMRLGSLEYRFPLALIERGWMAPPLGVHQLSGTLFYEAGAAWQQDTPDKYYTSAGAEFNAEVDVLYDVRIPMTLGYAKGFDKAIGGNQVYFRLQHNF